MQFKIVSAWIFQKRIYEAQRANKEFGCCVDVKQLNYYKENCICFLAYPEGQSETQFAAGYAIDTYAGVHESLVSVFKHPGIKPPLFDEIITHAKSNGARRLDCFAGITRTYEKHGFETYYTQPFNAEYAPKNWNYEVLGHPAVHYMILNKNINHKSNNNENN